ncbi:MAG: exodeoxyribonuclease VII small subunit [Actinomycetota bacterium]|nr:exodeoxyribonuclease VII small subunit [Actinomycetota bacterium]MDI6821379.1 exodeoxyribonuclease VII small subunit [Actinomycetota bacterium]
MTRSEELTFEEALNRLRKIVSLVQRKEASLEESLDLLEEGIRLANICTEKVDNTRWFEEGLEEHKSESNLS